MVTLLAAAVVVLAGLFFCALAASSLFAPAYATRFLLGFAQTPRVHYAELLVRLLVGVSLIAYAPQMLLPSAFSLFGWVLVATTVILLLLPWRWHRRFAASAVPQATRYITVIGMCSLGLGGLILYAVARGNAA